MRPALVLSLFLTACTAPAPELCNGLDDDGDGVVDEWVGGFRFEQRPAQFLSTPTVAPPELVFHQDASVERSERTWRKEGHPFEWYESWSYTGLHDRDGEVVERTWYDSGSQGGFDYVWDDGRLQSQHLYYDGPSVARDVFDYDEQGRPTALRSVFDDWDYLERTYRYEEVDGRHMAFVTVYEFDVEAESNARPVRYGTYVLDDEDRVLSMQWVAEKGAEPDTRQDFVFEDGRLVEGVTVDPRDDEVLTRFEVAWTLDEQDRPLEAEITAGRPERMRARYRLGWTWDDQDRLTSFVSEDLDDPKRHTTVVTWNEDGFVDSSVRTSEWMFEGDWATFSETTWSVRWDDALGGAVGEETTTTWGVSAQLPDGEPTLEVVGETFISEDHLYTCEPVPA